MKAHGARSVLISAMVTGAAISFVAKPVDGQVRGLPVFFDPTYSFDGRVGIDLGHGGEVDGLTIVGGGSYLFFIGNCRRLALSAAAGILNPSGGDFDTHFNGGATVSVLLNPCPRVLTRANPTFRLIAGAGLVRLDDRSVLSVMPIGLGAGYMLEIAFARLELWAAPRLHYRESLVKAGESDWTFSFSVGANIGLAGIFGLRLAADCCEDGVGGGYGLSYWF